MKPSLIIAGLGNPGAGYENTRHNTGFLAVDALSEHFGQGEWKDAPKFSARTQEARVVTVPVLLVKPQTYMNRSGEPLRKIIDFYKIDPAHGLLVLVDDIDIASGELRFRMKGGPGTHNGMRSVVQTFGENVPRLRIGIGTPQQPQDLATWVLSAFLAEERTVMNAAFAELPERIRSFVLESPKAESEA